VERVASRTGIRPVIVPDHVTGEHGVDDYFTLIEVWVSRLADAFRAAQGVDP
jgi:hypothetical protein